MIEVILVGNIGKETAPNSIKRFWIDSVLAWSIQNQRDSGTSTQTTRILYCYYYLFSLIKRLTKYILI